MPRKNPRSIKAFRDPVYLTEFVGPLARQPEGERDTSESATRPAKTATKRNKIRLAGT
jgi:hypothetical protein